MTDIGRHNEPYRPFWAVGVRLLPDFVKRHARIIKRVLLMGVALSVLMLGGLVWWIAQPIDPIPYLTCNASVELVDRTGIPLYSFLNEEEQWCFPREYEVISPYLIQATVAVEDQRFWRHPGVDAVAVVRAVLQNLRGGGIRSGASTITMQLVKMTDALPRSLWGKAVQAQRALRLERAADKQAILAAYLNKAPYGQNLVGAEAAALRYFGKPVLELTREEASLLAGLPKSPTRFEPIRHPERAKSRRDVVLARMVEEGYITKTVCAELTDKPVDAAWHEYTRLAPHLAMQLIDKPGIEGRVPLSLDWAAQSDVEARLKRYLQQYDKAVRNGAVMVVDVSTGELLVRVGGADFDAESGGQVDVCSAVRSPGSALKPFAYARAMEDQKLYPSEYLLDGPLDYGDYAPTNYSGRYHGLVTASEALSYSLNVPAVIVLNRIGVNAMQGTLVSAGITTLDRKPEYYGLGLVLGNTGLRLDELCAAYAALARGGDYKPLSVLENDREEDGSRIFSEGIAAALFEMLAQPLPRETAEDYVHAHGAVTPVAWKTGTSTGNHDAWAFVYNAHYVVGVWLGNNDGASSKRLVGAEAALPLAGAIFRRLPPKQGNARPYGAGVLKSVEVCADSGLPASPGCRATESVLLPREQYLYRHCAVHGQTTLSKEEHWPGLAEGWDLAVRQTDTAESVGEQTVKLSIASPAERAEYVMTGVENGDRIALRVGDGVAEEVHWYVDGIYVGATDPGRALTWNLKPGKHEVSCMVLSGAVDRVEFSVLHSDGTSRLREG